MNLFDSHCHLEDERFEDDWRDAVARMTEAGVNRCILAGSDMDTSGRIVKFADANAMIFGVVGIHPHEAKTYAQGDLECIEEWLGHPKIVGVGEIGLDYFYDLSPRETQREVCARQLLLAHRLGVPAVFHIGRARRHAGFAARAQARATRGRVALLQRQRGEREAIPRHGVSPVVCGAGDV